MKKLAALAVTFGVATLGCIPLIDMRHVLEQYTVHPEAILTSLFWIFMTTVLAYILYTVGLQHMETGKASVITSIEPVVASVIGCILYGENLTRVRHILVVQIEFLFYNSLNIWRTTGGIQHGLKRSKRANGKRQVILSRR